MALKQFSVDEIQSSVQTILKTSGVESYNRVHLPMTNDEGKEVGKAEVIYDGLAVLCAVNAELFNEAPKGAKQVICEKNLFLKPDSVIEIKGKEYKVVQIKEHLTAYIALVQAA